MKYRLVYTHRAVKDIKRLDPAVKKRIGKTLLRYQYDHLQTVIGVVTYRILKRLPKELKGQLPDIPAST